MFSNSTRLELVIVAAVLLVLMLCSRPPRSGNAEVRAGRADMPIQMPSSRKQSTLAVSPVADASMQNNIGTAHSEEMPPVDVQPRFKRVGIVDARNCGNPKYRDLLYGEVTVRWIWNGQKMVPKKVCVVDEGNGVTSVWCFDQQEGVTITERLEPIDSSQ
jgi:hypothetical protein